MKTYLFEGIQEHGKPLNWGKFLVGVPDVEWFAPSRVDPGGRPLLEQIGWTPQHVWVCDLATGEGAWFRVGGNARADLEKHRIWVCPLFEEFLTWLYDQDIERLHQLPGVVELPDAQFSINGYRRPGPHDVSFVLRKGDLMQIEWAGETRTVVCDGYADTGEGLMIRSLTGEEVLSLGRHSEAGIEMQDPAGDAARNTAQRAAETGLERDLADDDTLRDMVEQLAHDEQVASEELLLSEDERLTQVIKREK